LPEYLKSLVVIIGVASIVFAIAKTPVQAMLLVYGEFERCRNLWFSITLTAFLAHDIWIFFFLIAVFLRIYVSKGKGEVNVIFFILLACPLDDVEIPGFLGLNSLFNLNYFLLISLLVLLPAFIREANKFSLKYFCNNKTDYFLIGYLLLNVALSLIASGGNVSAILRLAFIYFISIFLPYAVTSRLVSGVSLLRAAIASYVIGALVMAALGIVETGRHWLLYSSLGGVIGIGDPGNYLMRGSSLRAIATAGGAIAYGYTMAVAFVLMLGLQRYFPKKILWLLGIVLLVGGMVASYSRGPWVGALVGFVVFHLCGPHRGKFMLRLLMVIALGAGILASTPYGNSLYQSSVTVDEGSYTYRALILELTISIILRNPLFGPRDPAYILELEALRQGEGIIDIVNSYIGVALNSGLIGLFLFLGFFAAAMFGIWKRMNKESDKRSEVFDLGRVLLATLVCILVCIYATSSISFVPIIYSLVVGLAVAYGRLPLTSAVLTSELPLVTPARVGLHRTKSASTSR
jgi:O-antigen ligase